MKCPFCSENNDRVVDSRESRDGATIRRRRECLECKRRFTSYEQIEDIPYLVVKSDGRREQFSRTKLLSGLMKACQKRPISANSQEEIVEEIEQALHRKEDREITTHEIGTTVMARLRELDPVAYVRFASVYRRFEDIGAFVEEVESLLSQRGSSPEPPEGRTPEGRTPEGRTPEGRTPEGRTPEGRTPEGRPGSG